MKICDLHCDTVLEIQAGADVGAGNPRGHVDVPRLRRGGVGLQVFACYLPTLLPHGVVLRECLDLLDHLERTCERLADDLVHVVTAAEAETVAAQGKTAVLAAVENGHALEQDLGNLDRLRERGVRYITLTHAQHLAWAASSGGDGPGPGGLTPWGVDLVRAMNDAGVIVDVSHVHERTFWDVVRVCRRPFIASHSNAAALCPSPRNLSDDQLRALAAAGGLAGINFYTGFLRPTVEVEGSSLAELYGALNRAELEHMADPARRQDEIHAIYGELRRRHGPVTVTADDVIDHIQHIVDLVGDDHVAFGSDFDGVPLVPRDLPDCGAYPHLLDRMRARGFSESSIEKIAWSNFLRVLRANE
ncbi:MAG: membrane dipeptidase [Acidobacteria bacterium]|nr:membrane dipeptidase [Acidobacteriota bacterium]